MARKQRVKLRVKQKKSLWQVIKPIIVIFLILGVLTSMRFCSDPKITLNLPSGKLGDWVEKIADFLPGGLIELQKPGDSGEPDPDVPPGEDVGDSGGEDDGNTPMNKHSCDAPINSYIGYAATCVSAGVKPYFECSFCHTLFDESGNETTSSELAIEINPEAHSTSNQLAINDGNTHKLLCTYDNNHIKAIENCTFKDYWSFNADEHYHSCDCGNNRDNEAHIDEDNDSMCDVCAYQVIDGDGDADGEGENNGGENTNPGESECQHRDANDDNLCDECGESFSDGADNPGNEGGETPPTEPDEPNEPEEPDETECEHVDSNSDGFCDKCKTDSRGNTVEDYRNMQGSSQGYAQFAYTVDEIEVPKEGNGDIIERYLVERCEVDIDVLYWNDAFYASNCKLELGNTLSIIPTSVETGYDGLYKIRIYFKNSVAYNTYADKIWADDALNILYNEDELYIDICYYQDGYVATNYEKTIIRCGKNGNGTVPKSAIASIEVDTICKQP